MEALLLLVHTADVAKGPAGESVLQRAVRIFEVFTSERPVMGVTEVARRAALPVTTTSRLVAELVDLGLLERLPDRRVRAGLRWWELAQRASPALGLREAAMPVMEDLQAVIGHHTQLGVREGMQVLFVERLSARGAVINITKIAGRLPLHASSSGLVLLAQAPLALQEEVLAGPLSSFTPATITTSSRLRSVLADVRRTGVALCAGHIHQDATGIAVPVRDDAGLTVAALSVVVPNTGAATYVPAVRAAARAIGRQLGAWSTPVSHPAVRP